MNKIIGFIFVGLGLVLLAPITVLGASASVSFSGHLQPDGDPHGHISSMSKSINLPSSGDYEVRVYYRANSGTQELYEEFNVYLDSLLLGRAHDPNQGDDFINKNIGVSYFSSGNHQLLLKHAHKYSDVGKQSVHPLEVSFTLQSSQNNSPIADAGPNKEIFEGQSVTLNGSASDPDGDPLSYKWACNGGSISNSTTLTPTFHGPSVSQNTTFICTLTATDSSKAKDSDNVNIYVKKSSQNNSPIANAGPNKEIFEGQSVTLNGSASDPNGDPLSYKWACNGGSISNSTTLTPTFHGPSVSQNTTFICTLTATDSSGAKDSDNVNIYVKKQADPDPDKFNLNKQVQGSGFISASPNQISYTANTQVSLVATPFSGWEFSHWQGDVSGNNSNTSVTMNTDKSVTAVFTKVADTTDPDKFNLNKQVQGSGFISASPNQISYTANTQVSLVATPFSGWEFSHWQGDVSGNNSNSSVTMNTDKSVTAVFTKVGSDPDPDRYNLNKQVQGSGFISASPNQISYSPNTQISLVATPFSGWEFSHWQGDVSGNNSNSSVTMNTNKSVTAVFNKVGDTTDQNQPQVDIRANGTSNSITVDDDSSFIISWISEDANSCVVSPNGWMGTSGQISHGSISSSKTFSVVCTNSIGTASDNVTVFVDEDSDSDPFVNLRANPSSIDRGEGSILSWVSRDATSCRATGGWSGSKSFSGSQFVNPDRDTTYRINCSNSSGDSVSDRVTIRVNDDDRFNEFSNLIVDKRARNITLNQSNFSSIIEAQAGDLIEFEITVRNMGNRTERIRLRDVLPSGLTYSQNSTFVDGQNLGGIAIVGSGINLGNVSQAETVRVVFRTSVGSIISGQNITNRAFATVSNNNQTFDGSTNINIRDRGVVLGIGDIPTGPENVLPVVFIITFIGSLIVLSRVISME